MRPILAQKLKIQENKIKKHWRLTDDIGIDSVDFWEIISKMEQEFGVSVKDEDVKDATTIQDVIDILSRKLEKLSQGERD